MSGTSGGKAKKYVVGAIAGAAILAGGAVLLKPGAGAGSVLNAILPSTFVRQGPVCVKVNAGRLNGPRTLFDVPPADLDASFIADLRQLKPDWKIFHEREAAPCEPWVVLHLAAKSFALDQFTYGAATTAGVAGGIAIYAPRYDESSGIAIATSSTFGGLSGNMATAASQGIANFIDDARYTPQPAPPEDGKICITLFADDEAMVIEASLPPCEFWNFQVGNFWMESLDYHCQRIHLNCHGARLNPDGSVTIVVAHRDPGHPNWLTTAGHALGTSLFRLIGAQDRPAQIKVRIVNFDTLTGGREHGSQA